MKQLAKYGSLQGKRVFITGGGSGIGESLVAEFAAQGALVAFVDIAVEASEALCRRLAEAGLTAPLFRHCDITDIASLQAVMAELAQKLGDFDILVPPLQLRLYDRIAPMWAKLEEKVTLPFGQSLFAVARREA